MQQVPGRGRHENCGTYAHATLCLTGFERVPCRQCLHTHDTTAASTGLMQACMHPRRRQPSAATHLSNHAMPCSLLPRYKSSYQADASSYHPPTKEGGGYWFTTRSQMHEPSPIPLSNTSTYKAEIQQSSSTAATALDRSRGLTCTISVHEAGRQRCACLQPAHERIMQSRFVRRPQRLCLAPLQHSLCCWARRAPSSLGRQHPGPAVPRTR